MLTVNNGVKQGGISSPVLFFISFVVLMNSQDTDATLDGYFLQFLSMQMMLSY